MKHLAVILGLASTLYSCVESDFVEGYRPPGPEVDEVEVISTEDQHKFVAGSSEVELLSVDHWQSFPLDDFSDTAFGVFLMNSGQQVFLTVVDEQGSIRLYLLGIEGNRLEHISAIRMDRKSISGLVSTSDQVSFYSDNGTGRMEHWTIQCDGSGHLTSYIEKN